MTKKEIKKELKKEVKKEEISLEQVVKSINKKYGEGSIVRLGDTISVKEDCIPTGALSLDLALGLGGIPRGRVIEIYGPESSGKSTLALNIIKNCQRLGDVAAYIDVENSMDIEYAKNVGVDVKNLLFSQPQSAEEGLGIMKDLVKSNKVGVIVLDSLAALAPQKEIDGEVGDQHIALQARLMSQTLRDVNGFISKTKTTVIFINQLRQKIGMVFGNPEETPGGKALKFYATVRIELRRKEAIKNKDGIHIGNRVKAKVVKNKAAAPMREGYFEIIFGRGIRKISSIFEAALDLEVITKQGNNFVFKDIELGISESRAKKFLKDNKNILDEIVNQTKKSYEEKQLNWLKESCDDDNIIVGDKEKLEKIENLD
jgi:recombination protein RecA